MPVAKESGGDFPLPPAGNHSARCFGVVDVGTQISPMYGPNHKVMLMFELPDLLVTISGEDQPTIITKEYTLSLSGKANLRHDLESWRGVEFTAKELEGFEVSKVVGAPALLNLTHQTSAKGRKRAVIAAITPLPKGMVAPEPQFEPVKFDLTMGQKSKPFLSLPAWIQKKIQSCQEWTNPAGATAETETPTDEPAESGGPPF